MDIASCFLLKKGKLIKHPQRYIGEREGRTWIGAVSSFHSSWLQHWLWIDIHENQFLINIVYTLIPVKNKNYKETLIYVYKNYKINITGTTKELLEQLDFPI